MVTIRNKPVTAVSWVVEGVFSRRVSSVTAGVSVSEGKNKTV